MIIHSKVELLISLFVCLFVVFVVSVVVVVVVVVVFYPRTLLVEGKGFVSCFALH